MAAPAPYVSIFRGISPVWLGLDNAVYLIQQAGNAPNGPAWMELLGTIPQLTNADQQAIVQAAGFHNQQTLAGGVVDRIPAMKRFRDGVTHANVAPKHEHATRRKDTATFAAPAIRLAAQILLDQASWCAPANLTPSWSETKNKQVALARAQEALSLQQAQVAQQAVVAAQAALLQSQALHQASVAHNAQLVQAEARAKAAALQAERDKEAVTAALSEAEEARAQAEADEAAVRATLTDEQRQRIQLAEEYETLEAEAQQLRDQAAFSHNTVQAMGQSMQEWLEITSRGIQNKMTQYSQQHQMLSSPARPAIKDEKPESDASPK